MFKPIEEYVEGDACVNCWGSGKTFGDVPTPKRITITGAGFTGADVPLNDTFIAEQEVGSPCIWSFDNGTVYGSWQTGAVNSFFQMGLTGQAPSFQTTEGLCVRVSTFGAQSMTIEIVEPPTPEYKIAIDQNFSPSLQTHFLNLGAANSDKVSIVARRRDQVKIHVRFSPEY